MIKNKSFQKLCIQAFLLSLLCASFIILPFVIKGRGILYIFTDFNLQQIPFNIISNESVKHGVLWSWNTDLGSNFIGSYSFYTLGSPFFWISTLFPAEFFPYLIAPLLILKFAMAGLTSFAYLQRFLKNKNFALLGSLLYAFSGFQIGNMFYNHFLDVTALFPLLLIALEEFLTNNRIGFFALAVALNSFVNYEFFVGEIVFLLIYFICRLISKEFKMPLKKWVILLAESIIGVGISGVLLLPSILFTKDIPRAVNVISGLKTLFYHPSVYLNIFKAFLLPAEAVNRSIITAASWTSTEAYLPVFGTVLTLAFVLSKRKNWLSVSIVTCLIAAFIPVFNSIFYLFNAEYYSRWFYMPVLLMVLATVLSLEKKDVHIKKGLAATFALWILFICGLFYAGRKQPVLINLKHFLFILSLAAAGFVCLLIILKMKNQQQFIAISVVLVAVISIASGIYNIIIDSRNFPAATQFTELYTDSSKEVYLPNDDDYRVDTTNCYYNTNILINKPSIDFFSSTVNGSIAQFYDSLGIVRVNNSYPDYNLYALRPFLSVKYVMTLNNTSLPSVVYLDNTKLPSLELHQKLKNYSIYQNKDFIPMGFAFENSISTQTFNSYNTDQKQQLLLKALVLTPRQLAKYSVILPELAENRRNDFSNTAYSKEVQNRINESCSSFTRNNKGFSAGIKLSHDNLVFFSVPYDKGWRATVNGKPVTVEKVDSGFMAVLGASGNNEISFTYEPQGLRTGLSITIISVLLLAFYFTAGYGFKVKWLKI